MVNLNNKFNICKTVIKGMFVGFFWQLCHFFYKVPIFLYYDKVTILFLIISSLIYYLLLRNNNKSHAFYSWCISIPASFLCNMIIIGSNLNDVVKGFIDSEYYDPIMENYYYPPGYGYATIIYYPLFYIITFITATLAIIFSKPKKRVGSNK